MQDLNFNTNELDSRFSTTDREIIQQLDALPQATRDRLAIIELALVFRGDANRGDLVNRFGIALAQATKDFSLYRTIAPENMIYDRKRRIHYRGPNFQPLFNLSADKILSTISYGYGDGVGGTVQAFPFVENPYSITRPKMDILAQVCQAIFHGGVLRVTYASVKGTTERDIVPHSIVNNGLRWHVRAFDRNSGQFKDFVLTRMKTARAIVHAIVDDLRDPETEALATVYPRERKEFDRIWQRFITLKVQAHPYNISNPEAINLDYGIDVDKPLEIKVRAAVAPYLLRIWDVDCTPDHSIHKPEYQLWLTNREVLAGLSNAVIVPGGSDLSTLKEVEVEYEQLED